MKHVIQLEKPRLSLKLRNFFALEPNIIVMSLTIFLLSAGEELWSRFMPKYLEALGATVAVIGLFGSTRDFLDAAYLYPSGYVSDRIGNQRALILFCAFSIVGYTIYMLTPQWHLIFLGLVFVMISPRLTPPAMFAIVAEDLPYNRRVMGFTVVAIFKRVPEMLAPLAGGLLIAQLGLSLGVRASLLITIALALLSIALQRGLYEYAEHKKDTLARDFLLPFRELNTSLRRLLLSDILVKTCERLVNVFIVLYVMNIMGRTALEVGLLVAIQKAATMVGYIPAAWLSDRYGRKPFVIISFIWYSLFPLALVLSYNFISLALAFVISGFKQAGEPARKAMVVDLARPSWHGRTVGLYHFIRSLAITPAAVVGGILWSWNPSIPFFVACCVGLFGTVLFVFAPNHENILKEDNRETIIEPG